MHNKLELGVEQDIFYCLLEWVEVAENSSWFFLSKRFLPFRSCRLLGVFYLNYLWPGLYLVLKEPPSPNVFLHISWMSSPVACTAKCVTSSLSDLNSVKCFVVLCLSDLYKLRLNYYSYIGDICSVVFLPAFDTWSILSLDLCTKEMGLCVGVILLPIKCCMIEPETDYQSLLFQTRTSANAFRRVKEEEVEFVDERLQDNSYWAKVSWFGVILLHLFLYPIFRVGTF